MWFFFAIISDKCKKKIYCLGNAYKNPVMRQHSAFSYVGLLLDPVKGFGRGCFCPSGKKRAFIQFVPPLIFFCMEYVIC